MGAFGTGGTLSKVAPINDARYSEFNLPRRPLPLVGRALAGLLFVNAERHGGRPGQGSELRCVAELDAMEGNGPVTVTTLHIENFRSVEHADFEFPSRFTLLIGANSSGKTSVLEAFQSWYAALQEQSLNGHASPLTLHLFDLRHGADLLTVGGVVKLDGHIHTGEASIGRGIERQRNKVCFKGEQVAMPPLLLLTTNRDISGHGQAEWFNTRPEALEALNCCIPAFLPQYSELRVSDNRALLHETGTEHLTPITRLSGGERALLTLLISIVRSLAGSLREDDTPIASRAGVVLIDSLEQHLHPVVQRNMVPLLTTHFPNCQFIATSHSPLVVGELQEVQVHVMDDGTNWSAGQTFGQDVNSILECIMHTEPRTHRIHRMLATISEDLGSDDPERIQNGKETIEHLAGIVGENSAEVVRLRTWVEMMGDDW